MTLLIDCNRGIYIPQCFATSFDLERWHVDHLTEAVEILRAGPDHEHYWDAWEELLDAASFTDEQGQKYYLHQDDDLFAAPVEVDDE